MRRVREALFEEGQSTSKTVIDTMMDGLVVDVKG
jgi:hypothetical protein